MAILRLWPATNGPAAVTVDTDNYTMGTEFRVTASGCTATAVYFWRPANAPATTFSAGIYQITGAGSTGTLVASVTGLSVAANYNGWYRVQLTAPIALTSGTGYVAVVNSSTNNFYAATSAYWSSGAGSAGITNGVLVAPPDNSGAGKQGNNQGAFAASTVLTFPNTGFGSSNYWVDVEVDDGVSSGVTGTVSAAVPKLTASLPGTIIPPTTGSINAAVPKVTASVSGTVDNTTYATMSATLPKVTGSISGASLTTGTVSAAVPKATAGLPGSVYTTGSLSAAVPKVTAALSDVVVRTVAQENALTTGVNGPAWWKDGLTSEAIPGFARSSYYAPGETAEFSINYNAAYTVGVWRFGHYQGNGARQVATFAGTTASQPAAVTIPNSNGAVTCAAWTRNVTWNIPSDATPGMYELVLSGANATDYGHIVFCVSDANSKRPVLNVVSDATWHAAYNGFGGNNVYGATKGIGTSTGRALCSTYDKPVITRDYVPQTYFFNANYPYLKWSERMGINAGYATIEQIHNDPTILDGRDVVVFTGHNEYISQVVMDKTQALLAAGVTNVVNVAGNDFFWRVAFGGTTFPAGSTSTSTGRVMWCKKDTMPGPTAIRSGGAGTPFTNSADWTGSWQDTRWSGREPSSALFGDQFIANGIRADQVQVPFSMKGSPAWRNCAGVQALTTGQTYSFAAGTLGMEWDKPVSGGPVQTAFTSTTITLTNGAADANGENYDITETATHGVTMGRSVGGSYIVNFNSDQWPWALEQIHDRGSAAADVNGMQMTLNVLADVGVAANSTMVSAASLTLPTPVSDIDTDYNLPSAVTGVLAGALPKTTGSVAGSVLTVGSVAAAVPKVTASLAGVITGPTTGSLAASMPLLTSALTGSSLITGSLSVTLPKLVADLPGVVTGPTTGQLVASVPVVGGSAGGVTITVGVLSGVLPRVRSRIDSATQAVIPHRLSATLRQPRFKGTMRP